MNGQPDSSNSATTDNEEGFDPRDAAAILTKSTRKARRKLDANPPLIGLIRAALVLFAYGNIWLNVRGQHPYIGPKSWTIVALISVTGIVIRMSTLVFRLATEGVSGRPSRSWWAEGAAVVLVLAAVFAFMGALVQAGVAHEVVYGIYPAAAPLIMLGGTAVGFLGARTDWPGFGAALAAVCAGAGAAFAGPAGAWGVAGLGLCAALLGHTAAIVWLRRSKAAR